LSTFDQQAAYFETITGSCAGLTSATCLKYGIGSTNNGNYLDPAHVPAAGTQPLSTTAGPSSLTAPPAGPTITWEVLSQTFTVTAAPYNAQNAGTGSGSGLGSSASGSSATGGSIGSTSSSTGPAPATTTKPSAASTPPWILGLGDGYSRGRYGGLDVNILSSLDVILNEHMLLFSMKLTALNRVIAVIF
jgi:hypothetical protein